MNRDGRRWYIPMMFCELPFFWVNNDCGIDIAMFQVAPMDEHGNFNLGPQVADMWGVIKSAKKIIVEVNQNMPIAHGYQTQLNLYGIDYVVEGDNTPLAELPMKQPSEIDKNRGARGRKGSRATARRSARDRQSASLYRTDDRAVGSAQYQCAHRDVHRRICGFVRGGQADGNKPIDKGKAVYTFAGGDKRLYDFIDDNPISSQRSGRLCK